ncbi:hypothetical protein [Hwangdonia lutea]|uniref:Uncharacterized protein n=1 Tax=Hwangdonia lutea TaxID=3075823 RepID=A0AA97ENP8_9FLAO|nr:hypothetical protein [Hwangdonia sp. SCSIO 19198]WOD44301.1 hypothetical protein RNZ46_03335 [Hwangdonia sp. SCSIO 19198]
MKNKNLHNMKSSGFKTPDNYFESFDDKLLAKLKAQNKLDDIKTTGFKVPNDYFETIDDAILSTVQNQKDTKVVSLFSWRKMAYASAVAASIILMFNLFFNTPEKLTFDSLEIASIENYLAEEGFTTYELATLLTDEELNSEAFTNTQITEDSLEDYLLNNANIEDLLID